MDELVGDATKSRLIAVYIDQMIAVSISIFTVAVIPSQNPLIKGSSLVLAYLLYFIIFEGLWSRTPGKYFQGLEIRKIDGSHCDFPAAITRAILLVVEANPFLLGGLPAGLTIISTKRKQRIGDILAGTVVVSSKTISLIKRE